MFESLLGEGEADQAPAKLGHEVDGFRRNLFRRQHEIAFVFAVFVVHNHDHPSRANFFDCGGDIGEWGILGHGQIVARMVQFLSATSVAYAPVRFSRPAIPYPKC